MIKGIIRSIIGKEMILHLQHQFPSARSKKQREEMATFYQKFVESGDLCFDIGANYGNKSLSLLDIGGKVVAVEPQRGCARYLRKQIKGDFKVIEKGVGAKPGILPFHISSAHTLSSFSNEWIDSVKSSGRFSHHRWDEQLEVEITTLDALIADHGLPKFIKIDVEGYELEVLSGLSFPIEWLCFEYTVPERTQEAIACLTKLEKINAAYQCNFVQGESNQWASSKWMSIPEMKSLITSPSFLSIRFGDIYVHGKG